MTVATNLLGRYAMLRTDTDAIYEVVSLNLDDRGLLEIGMLCRGTIIRYDTSQVIVADARGDFPGMIESQISWRRIMSKLDERELILLAYVHAHRMESVEATAEAVAQAFGWTDAQVEIVVARLSNPPHMLLNTTHRSFFMRGLDEEESRIMNHHLAARQLENRK